MNAKVFLDTNLIIYLYSETEIQKRDIAYKCLNDNDCIISTQILNEASNVWTKKYNLCIDTIKNI
jgi:predicted nucleic acid-binding protein